MNGRDCLREHGVWVARGLLDRGLIDSLSVHAASALGGVSPEHRRANRSQGSLVNLADHPAFAAIIGHPALGAMFEFLEFPDPVFSSGYIISKPPQGPPLFWHQDWWGWDDPMSYTDRLAQVFVMIYLTDTTPENGCLRFVPGSHRRRHALHEARAAHAEALSRVDDPGDPAYASCPGERAVPVRAGDVVVGDARVLHGAYANRTERERALLTLWYHPDFRALPGAMRARIAEIFRRKGVDTDPAGRSARLVSDWPDAQRRLVEHLLPRYEGACEPHPWNRQPDLSRLGGA